MKTIKYLFVHLSIVAVCALAANAQQLIMPRPSQWASVTQTVGVTDLTINYSRPAVKGRKIFGDPPKDSYAAGEKTLDDQNKRPVGMVIVPYGHVWRTGANEATQFITTSEVTINGQKLPAGKYSLHTIPGKDEWTIIINSDAGQWGSFNYDPAKDVLRVKAKPEMMNDSQELLSYSFDPVTDKSATVNIRWERVRVPFTVGVDTVSLAMAKARAAVAAARPDDFRTRANAGSYAMDYGLTDEGTKLLTDALQIIDTQLAAKETYPLLQVRANVLFELGRLDEGFTAADKALAFGKANSIDTSFLEKRVSDVKASRKK